MMRLIIAGSRNATEADVSAALSKCRWLGFVTAVVSGTARGADRFGESWAKHHSLEVIRFPADWKKHGRRAGPVRNKLMAENAEALVAVWDGESPGTKSMIELARRRGLRVLVYLAPEGRVQEYAPEGDLGRAWDQAIERAAILEFGEGCSRPEAERRAGREERPQPTTQTPNSQTPPPS